MPIVSHCAPGDYVVEPISSNPTAKPPLAVPPGKLLQLRRPGRDPAWLPLVDKALRTLTKLVSAQQRKPRPAKRSACSVWSLRTAPPEHVAKALQSSTIAIEALNAIAIEREHAIPSLVLRLAEATRQPAPPPRARPRQNPPRPRRA